MKVLRKRKEEKISDFLVSERERWNEFRKEERKMKLKIVWLI